VSGTVSDGRETARHDDGLAAVEAVEARESRGRGRWVALSVVVLVAAAGLVWAWRAGVFSPAASSGASGQGTPAPATATVTRQDLEAATPVSATLGYAGSYAVSGQGSGTLTWAPSPGQVISQGQVLYRVDNGSPVVLLYGSVPAWRSLYEGSTGQDVAQLNHDLVRLGYASRVDFVPLGWDYYSWETAYAVQHLEEHLGVSWPSGNLLLGQAVFEPEALRVSQVTGTLGSPVSGSAAGTGSAGTGSAAGTGSTGTGTTGTGSTAGTVLTATSDRQVVTIPLDASDQTEVKVGDAVSVTLPNGTTTPGVISSIGRVATITQSGSGGNPTTTIPVVVKLTDPAAAGTLDQAPVTVSITTQSSAGPVLTVPVTALVAQSPGGYAVEVVGPGSTRRWVPVTPGIYDGDNGLVQVTGALTPGERVVVAAS
jgi:hypothetical protein